MANQNQEGQNPKNKMTAKRIAAILGIVLLFGLYIVTLIVAIVDRGSSGKLFMACLIATVAVPLLLWIYIWMYGVMTNKHTIASFDIRKPEDIAAQVSLEEAMAKEAKEPVEDDADGVSEDGQSEAEGDDANA
ncbi:MAG: hypothetical protein J6U66_09485 [Lachnospiraceae bacterium]|nr:hypothetical protein [Lachnospiraceae bacterium]